MGEAANVTGTQASTAAAATPTKSADAVKDGMWDVLYKTGIGATIGWAGGRVLGFIGGGFTVDNKASLEVSQAAAARVSRRTGRVLAPIAGSLVFLHEMRDKARAEAQAPKK